MVAKMSNKRKLLFVSLIVIFTFLSAGCSEEKRSQQESLRKDITIVESEDSQFVQTGYTKIYNASGSDTQLITLYDKKTGVEYIMLRNNDMTSIQPRTAGDGGILLHKAEEK